MASSLLVPLSIVAVYLLVVKWLGPRFMADREPLKIEPIIIVYNALQIVACAHTMLTVRPQHDSHIVLSARRYSGRERVVHCMRKKKKFDRHVNPIWLNLKIEMVFTDKQTTVSSSKVFLLGPMEKCILFQSDDS
ncbi:hypothetical protein ONE63_008481 [Megalurothrips usitatus]|uniref:Very-long-chain 3-oxoacyl-CoA synthase n=1 Tax=Megalurothrips usitatus TaxID=439358 RepID=A0AAV7XQI7_9NEOP|nr:hypothetical protein ONE63_008481 [Megalurothrips usitatus]